MTREDDKHQGLERTTGFKPTKSLGIIYRKNKKKIKKKTQKSTPQLLRVRRQNHHLIWLRGTKTPYPKGRKKIHLLLVKPGRDKISKALQAWRTKDREEGGMKPPSPSKPTLKTHTLSLSLSRKLRAQIKVKRMLRNSTIGLCSTNNL